jgi:hypothetical protein
MNKTDEATDIRKRWEATITIRKECYFCGNPTTVRFHEHYTFCANCSAIYTFMVVHEHNCIHIGAGTPVVSHPPWYETDKSWIYEYEEDDPGVFFKCSVCHADCEVDGW